jgi:hypothetical protein
MPNPNLVTKVIDLVFDAVDAGHTTANTAIIFGGVKISAFTTEALHWVVLFSFIGLIWRCWHWSARRRRDKLERLAAEREAALASLAKEGNQEDGGS